MGISVLRDSMTYEEIIKKQRKLLPKSRNWWPLYFYHFTDMQNALGIIDKGWIFGRHIATENNLMKNDNASSSVISLSTSNIQEYARLYFRPKTPTQFHSEGYKPEPVRKADINASCPIPVFFFLDAEKILNMEETKFSEVSCAVLGNLNLMTGEDNFSKLAFDKIFHEGSFNNQDKSDIIKHRHAEVVRLGGIPINDCLKGIVCRSRAEKQTLLYILRNQYYEKYIKYRKSIIYNPQLDMFFNNGIFVKEIRYDNSLHILLNDSSKRKTYNNKNTMINVKIAVYYLDNDQNIINRKLYYCESDYLNTQEFNVPLTNDFKGCIILEIHFDNILMYKNLIDINLENMI